MAIDTFEDYIGQWALAVDQLRDARNNLEALLEQHTAKGFSTLTTNQFNDVKISKTEYDLITSSIDNLVNSWWPTHRTNIENFLTETPT